MAAYLSTAAEFSETALPDGQAGGRKTGQRAMEPFGVALVRGRSATLSVEAQVDAFLIINEANVGGHCCY